jgi:hypothetical protein
MYLDGLLLGCDASLPLRMDKAGVLRGIWSVRLAGVGVDGFPPRPSSLVDIRGELGVSEYILLFVFATAS